MKKVFLLALLLSVSLINAAETKLGKAITLKDKTPVSQILSKPTDFEGKTVLVEGKILGVCKEKGCWIEVAGEKKGQKIKVKVNDGEIVFPKNSKGKTALVEGTVEEVNPEAACDKEMKKDGKAKMDMKECAEKAKDAKMDMKECKENAAKVEGAKKDDCCAGAAKKVYQIKGLGAVIK
jgi:hypothetical protein